MSARICVLIAGLCLFWPAAWAQETQDRPAPLAPGTEAPDFTAVTLEDVPISLSQWDDRVVVLNYFITWYRDAAEHLSMMEDLQDTYSEQGMRLLSISLDEGERAEEQVSDLVRQQQIAHPVVRDAEQKIAGRYGVRALPAIFIIDRNGKIAHYHEGYTEGDERRLSEAVAAALGVEAAPEDTEEEQAEVSEEPEKPVCHCFRREGE